MNIVVGFLNWIVSEKISWRPANYKARLLKNYYVVGRYYAMVQEHR